MKNVYSNTQKSNGRVDYEALKSQWAVEDDAVKDLYARASVNGTYADGIAPWAAALKTLLQCDDARRGASPNYRYVFADEDRMRLADWLARWPADESDDEDIERLLLTLLKRPDTIDVLVKAVFDALEHVVGHESRKESVA